MKKLVVSLLAISLLAPLSVRALEKPATPDVDIETFRIEKSLGEDPEDTIALKKFKADLRNKLFELRKKAVNATGNVLEKIKEQIKEYEALVEAKLK